MRHSPTNVEGGEEGQVSAARKRLLQEWRLRDCSGLSRYWRLVVKVWILIVVAFAGWPSIITVVFFIGVKEYSMWWGGVNEETFRHVGQ
jgi:hypothetical protein